VAGIEIGKLSAMGIKILIGWGVLAIMLGLWFVGLGQWRWFFDYASLPLQNHSLWTLENWLYYPRPMWRDGLGWLAVLLTAVAVWQAIRNRHPAGVFLYLAFFLVGLATLTFRLYKISRFGMLISPVLDHSGCRRRILGEPAAAWLAAPGRPLLLLAGVLGLRF
jgi:hypothetical protein